MENVKSILVEHDIRPSVTRIKILNYLDQNRNHPTVETIYNDLIEELPTLSKTSVYNILKLFSEHHLVDIINSYNKEQRFDIVDGKHSHFICDICHKIYDIPHLKVDYQDTPLEGFTIYNDYVELRGICKECQKKINQN